MAGQFDWYGNGSHFNTSPTADFANQKPGRWWCGLWHGQKTSPLWSYSAAIAPSTRDLVYGRSAARPSISGWMSSWLRRATEQLCRRCVGVLGSALVASLGFSLGDTLSSASAPVIVVFATYRGEHVEKHAIDGAKHARGEFVAGARQLPAGRQIEGDDRICRWSISLRSLRQSAALGATAVDLLDQQDVAGLAVAQETKQFGTRELSAALVLGVCGGDGEAMLWQKLHLAAGALASWLDVDARK